LTCYKKVYQHLLLISVYIVCLRDKSYPICTVQINAVRFLKFLQR